MSIKQRIALEKTVVRRLIRDLKKVDWIATFVFDGDEHVPVKSEAEVMALVFDLDEATITFTKGNRNLGVFIVLGNDGWDAICDYNYDDKYPEFADTIEKLSDEFSERHG